VHIDYALIVSLALYGWYIFTLIRSRPGKRAIHVIAALVIAVFFYTALKQVFIAVGIQPR
jgi:hypothetical protein